MPVRVLDWRWAVDERTNRTQAGVALATARAPGSAIDTGVTVYGVVIRNQLHGLECSDDAGATWSSATLQTIIPEADLDKTSFNQRYNHRWPHGLTREQAVVEPDVGLTGSLCLSADALAEWSASSPSGRPAQREAPQP